MALDGLVVHSIVDELSKTLIGGKVDKVHQPEDDELVLHIRNNKENHKLILSASASNPRVYLASNYKKENPLKAPMFCMLFRKHIQNGVITNISQVGFERIIRISVESYDELKEKTTKDIIIEIMGRHSNIILVHSEDSRIIDSAKRIPPSISRVRQILPGQTYVLPPSQHKINPISTIDFGLFSSEISNFDGAISKAIYSKFLGVSPAVAKEICFRSDINDSLETSSIDNAQLKNLYEEFNTLFNNIRNNIYSPSIVLDEKIDKVIDFSCITFSMHEDLSFIKDESMSKILEDYYATKDIKDRIHQRSSDLRKSITIKLDRLYNKLKKQQSELSDTNNAHIYKEKGELITSYIYMIEKGMDKIEVANFYDPECKNITIELNKNLTPSENAQKLFKKYAKLKTAKIELSSQIELSYAEIDYLENIVLSINNCDTIADLNDIREELGKEGYLKYQGKSKNKKEVKSTTKPMEFISSDGFKILVGKNNKQNDNLTLKIASHEDLWLHTKNIPGSHVIIKCEGKIIPQQTILEAGMLAAFYSKSRMSSQVPVDYTLRKHIKKPNGSKPGMVIYETNNTIYVTPSEEVVAKLRLHAE